MIVTLTLRTQTVTLTVAALNTSNGGGSGVSVHNQLTGRDTADAHPQSAVTGLVAALAAKAASDHTHASVYEPANANLQAHVASTSNPHSTTAAQVGADAAGTAATAVGALAATLGTAATKDVGTTAGTVAAGDDSRITGAVQESRTVSAAGLATGGGDLSANRTITVTASTAETVSTGTATNEAVTPGAYKDSTPYYVDRSADWTLALTDRNKDQWFNNGASALVCTIPLNATVAFAIGDTIPLVRIASGTATIDAATSVTLNGVSGGSCTIQTRYQGALLKKVGTDSWIVSGDVSAVA